MTLEQVDRLIDLDKPTQDTPRARKVEMAIYRLWSDRPVTAALDRSVLTVKADACLRTFSADGRGIVWAVVDSGIDGGHAHFTWRDTLAPDGLEAGFAPPTGEGACGLRHVNFTDDANSSPLVDEAGHGTHVAGIIAGARRR